MTLLGAAVGREIEHEHEELFHERRGRDLDARFSVEYPDTAEERLIGDHTILCTCTEKALRGRMPPVHVH